jgi:hypothetical protein
MGQMEKACIKYLPRWGEKTAVSHAQWPSEDSLGTQSPSSGGVPDNSVWDK